MSVCLTPDRTASRRDRPRYIRPIVPGDLRFSAGSYTGPAPDRTNFLNRRVAATAFLREPQRCARCGEPLYTHRLNANYDDDHDRQIWHVPGFCGLAHIRLHPGEVLAAKLSSRGIDQLASTGLHLDQLQHTSCSRNVRVGFDRKVRVDFIHSVSSALRNLTPDLCTNAGQAPVSS
jgi:hypothetical protein